MRYAVGQKEETRKRILAAAGRGFRRQGYDGIGVDGLAKEAGITSGAFYGHFPTKESVFEAAVVAGLEELRVGVETFYAEHGENWVEIFAKWYFSKERRQELACGCALPSLSSEVTRASDSVRSMYQTELLLLIETIATALTGGTEAERRERAAVLLSLLAGGVTLARAVRDEAVAEQIAHAVSRATVAASAPKA